MVAEISSIIFKREIEGVIKDLIIPEEFVKDYHYSNDNHLMIILRVIGTDSEKVYDFLNGSEKESFHIETVEKSTGEKKSDDYILTSMYLDEGPPLSVDINQELFMVRAILDFKKK
ncbi:hypothetical protein [Methanobacterium ferruginis]|uniref:hypothetical protein n=1 Tax=Methanobacterium ferruginis TaxID=710191 RepID=UPI0025727AC8|nr:hypothetical protein [Methanobacterium ferruginis]BDZ69202.1 hypothetical protein GCM10025860_26500 [Methanobacterium ferruginis]